MITMYPPQNNGIHTTLAVPINSADTSLQVANGSVLPTPPTVLTLGVDEDAELVLVSSRTGNFLTVTRGYNGTTAKTWDAGEWIYRAITAQDIQALQDNVQELDNGKQALLDASNPLPITGGGTGGITGPEALANLGYVDKAVWTELWTGTLNPGGSITIPNLSSNWMQICVRTGAPLANIPLVVFSTPLRGSAAYSGTNSQIVISVDLGISGNNVTLNSCMAATHSSSGHTIADNTVVGVYGMVKR